MGAAVVGTSVGAGAVVGAVVGAAGVGSSPSLSIYNYQFQFKSYWW